jgi:uncharacterized protein YndB with AHSA1/START domain
MSDYERSFTIKATPATVYDALTTPSGLRGWWTHDCDITSEVGDTIHFRFGPTHKDMRIEKLEPRREVQWLCTGAHIGCAQFTHKDEWVGTRIAFHLTPEGDGRIRLNFQHAGLVPALECYDLCSDGWRYFLDSLLQFAETGHGTPYETALAAAN